MLIAEFDGGNYRPVAAVASINEAREIAASDICAPGRRHWNTGGEPACPDRYVAWAQAPEGSYLQVKEILP